MTRASAGLTRLSVLRTVSAAARSLREPGQREFAFKGGREKPDKGQTDRSSG